jgi:hypothetical protein
VNDVIKIPWERNKAKLVIHTVFHATTPDYCMVMSLAYPLPRIDDMLLNVYIAADEVKYNNNAS